MEVPPPLISAPLFGMAKQAPGKEKRRRETTGNGEDGDQNAAAAAEPPDAGKAPGSGVDGTGDAAAHDPAGTPEQLTAENEQLKAQVADLQGDLLRKQADFENFRKRVNRDKEEAIKFANSSLLLDLTAVIDDFDRAIAAGTQAQDFTTLHSGIELIEKQFLHTLERKWGLVRFASAAEPFDPERHEALATERSSEHTRATVLEDYQKGYTLHGRVVRAARVRVAIPAADTGAAAAASAATDASVAADTSASAAAPASAPTDAGDSGSSDQGD